MKDKEDSEAQYFATGVQLDKFGELIWLLKLDKVLEIKMDTGILL